MSDLLMRFMTAAQRPVQCDVEKRILRGAVFATTGLASDGWIVLPLGIDLARFQANPIVTARHINGQEQTDPNPIVIARALALAPSDMTLTCEELQFADTQLGRDYAYLCGVNKDAAAYVRGWSIEGPVLERGTVGWKEARTLAGEYWDDALAERLRRTQTNIAVALRFQLALVASVPIGADRGALTRAGADGCQTAYAVLARMDFDAASMELAEVKQKLSEHEARVARLEQDIQALRGEGASAAARRDSEAVLAEVRGLSQLFGKGE